MASSLLDARMINSANPGLGAAMVFSGRQRLILLAAFTFLVILRIPQAWFYGRFMGEEGTIFLAYAWHRPAGEALWHVFGGYLNLGANASALLAVKLIRMGVLPLAWAPRLTMSIALLFQMIPAALILTGRGRWLANRSAVVACLAIIAISPMTEEVFGNILHIQFHLALSAALILALDTPVSGRGRAAYCLLLLLGPLCGPGAIVMLPLFVLRTLLDRDRQRAMQTLVLGIGAAAQMLLFYTSSPVRGHFLDPGALANLLFIRLVALPYTSAPLTKLVGKFTYLAYRGGGWEWWGITALSAIYFGWLLITALRNGRDGAFWLILTALMLAGVSYGAGMLMVDPSQWFTPGAAERYNFIPLVLLGIGLVALIMRGDEPYRRICRVLCILQLLSGMVTFFIPIKEMRSGPDWQNEVTMWQHDHNYMLKSWPAKWLIDLSDHDRPCPAPRMANVTSGAAANDPTYCESRWLVLVLHDSRYKAWSEHPAR